MKLKLIGLMLVSLVMSSAMAESAGREWRNYGGDAGASKYSSLDQINARNVGDVKIAWRTPALDPRLKAQYPSLTYSNNFRSTPLVVGGVLYISNAIGLVEARNPATGEVIWTQEPPSTDADGLAGTASRSIAYWQDGRAGRIVTIRSPYLFVLDAKTGKPVASFGENGRVDLRDGGANIRFLWTAPSPIVVKGVIVVGGQPTRSDIADMNQASLPGHLRGFDARTGKLLWTFHTIPREQEFGTETWIDESWQNSGKVKVWAAMSADEDLGYIYAPLSAPANDWWGGKRPGNNLFSDSLVCIDARTGKRVWHYQLVHHDLWDYDLPAAPILVDLPKGHGRKVKAVVQVTKMATVFAFDRLTGEPLWPIEERPVPASTVPGEWTSPTQPFPTKPLPFEPQGLDASRLIDFTPELHQEAVAILDQYVHGPIFTPPSIKGTQPGEKKGTLILPGWVGGANWTGAAVDPREGVLYVPSVNVPFIGGLQADGNGGYKRAREATLYLDGPRGLPLVKPPYGRITAIDLKTGEHVWSVPNGDGPRDHPLLKHLNLPQLGQPGRVAPLLTRTLLFAGEGDKVGISMPPFSGGKLFRAYDKATGKELWKIDLGAGTTGAPMTYQYKGKQYIVVAVGSVDHDAEIVALSLP